MHERSQLPPHEPRGSGPTHRSDGRARPRGDHVDQQHTAALRRVLTQRADEETHHQRHGDVSPELQRPAEADEARDVDGEVVGQESEAGGFDWEAFDVAVVGGGKVEEELFAAELLVQEFAAEDAGEEGACALGSVVGERWSVAEWVGLRLLWGGVRTGSVQVAKTDLDVVVSVVVREDGRVHGERGEEGREDRAAEDLDEEDLGVDQHAERRKGVVLLRGEGDVNNGAETKRDPMVESRVFTLGFVGLVAESFASCFSGSSARVRALRIQSTGLPLRGGGLMEPSPTTARRVSGINLQKPSQPVLRVTRLRIPLYGPNNSDVRGIGQAVLSFLSTQGKNLHKYHRKIDDAQYGQHPEDPAPVEVLHQDASEDRSKSRPNHGRAGEQAHVRAPLGRGSDVPHRPRTRPERRRAAGGLKTPEQEEQPVRVVRCEGDADARDAIQREADHEDGSTAEGIREAGED